MDAAAQSKLRAIRHRAASSLSSAGVQVVRAFESLRSLGIRRDIFRAIELWPRSVMLLGSFQHVIVRPRLPFVIVRVPTIFAHRMIDKLVPHQNPATICMTVKRTPAEVQNLPFLEFSTSPDRPHG